MNPQYTEARPRGSTNEQLPRPIEVLHREGVVASLLGDFGEALMAAAGFDGVTCPRGAPATKMADSCTRALRDDGSGHLHPRFRRLVEEDVESSPYALA